MLSILIPHLTIVFLLAAGAGQTPHPPAARASSPQKPVAAIDPDEAILLTNGWALLSQGLEADAAQKAAQALTKYPRSAAALDLAVEAEMARGGARAGMAAYERWLGSRTMEEPGIVRRLATGVLREAMRSRDEAARFEALQALAAEGDAAATAALGAAESARGAVGTRTLARHGNARAIQSLIAEARSGAAGVPTIEALADSGSRDAVAPLTKYLADRRVEIRGAAVEALGKLGASDQIAQIQPLLNDRSVYVRAKAAGALLRMGSGDSVPLLQELATDPSPDTRLLAAEAMASQPDSQWLPLVKELAASDNPETRVAAARLLAPQDPEFARRVLEPLASSDNPAVRDLASRGLADTVTGSDLTSLRGLLKSADVLTRVRAGARVLELTR